MPVCPRPGHRAYVASAGGTERTCRDSSDVAGGAPWQAPASARNEVYKLNNLFGRIAAIRRLALLPAIKPILDELIGGDALICNSLNFERGSQQPFHIDSWYMPGPTEDALIAASFALDDVDADSGEVETLPDGSISIPVFEEQLVITKRLVVR